MKKLITLILALFLLVAGNVFAQSADVDVTATVEGSLSITNQADVEFGTVQAGQEHTISTTVNEANLGRVFIEGQGSTLVYFDTESSIELDNGNGADFTANLSFWGGETNDPGATSTLGSSEELSSGGEFYVFIGAVIDLPNTQENGVYTGTTTISVSYTDF